MEILTRHYVISRVPERWSEQYKNYDSRRDPSKAEITRKLATLTSAELNAERVDAIIGNDSWTTISCDECDQKKEALMMMVTDNEWGGHKVGLCYDCLSQALIQMENER